MVASFVSLPTLHCSAPSTPLLRLQSSSLQVSAFAGHVHPKATSTLALQDIRRGEKNIWWRPVIVFRQEEQQPSQCVCCSASSRICNVGLACDSCLNTTEKTQEDKSAQQYQTRRSETTTYLQRYHPGPASCSAQEHLRLLCRRLSCVSLGSVHQTRGFRMSFRLPRSLPLARPPPAAA